MSFSVLISHALGVAFWIAAMMVTFTIIGKRTKSEMQRAERSDNRHFTVRVPRIYTMFILIIGCIFLVLALICLVLGLATQSVSYFPAAEVLIVFSIPELVIYICWYLWKVQVDGKAVIYTSFIGRRRSITSAQIEKARAAFDSSHNGIEIYVSGIRLFRVTDEYLCYESFRRWLASEGIDIEPDTGGITKKSLSWIATRQLTLVFIGLAVFFILLIIIIEFISGAGLSPLRILQLSLLIVGCMAFVLAVVFLPTTCVGLYRIGVQERALGFNFEQEMAGKRLVGGVYKDEKWFVAISSVYVLAFRRDCVASVAKATGRDSSLKGQGVVLAIKLTDGRTWKTRVMDIRVSNAFLKWANSDA